MKYECHKCYKSFYDNKALDYHLNKRKKSCTDRKQYKDNRLICENCNKTYASQRTLKRHQETTCGKNHLSNNQLTVIGETNNMYLPENIAGAMLKVMVMLQRECIDIPSKEMFDTNNKETIVSIVSKLNPSNESEKQAIKDFINYLTKTINHRQQQQKTTDLVCSGCNKEFSRKYTLERHQKKSCPQTTQVMNNGAIVGSNHGTVNSAGRDLNNNTINNISAPTNLVAFGKEDMSFITFNAQTALMNKGLACIPKMVEIIHFSKKRPQNHNVYVPNHREPYALIFDGVNWIVADKGRVLERLIDDNKNWLSQMHDEQEDDIKPHVTRKFENFLTKTGSKGDKKEKKKIEKDVWLYLFNHKKEAETVRAQMIADEKALKALE